MASNPLKDHDRTREGYIKLLDGWCRLIDYLLCHAACNRRNNSLVRCQCVKKVLPLTTISVPHWKRFWKTHEVEPMLV